MLLLKIGDSFSFDVDLSFKCQGVRLGGWAGLGLKVPMGTALIQLSSMRGDTSDTEQQREVWPSIDSAQPTDLPSSFEACL